MCKCLAPGSRLTAAELLDDPFLTVRKDPGTNGQDALNDSMQVRRWFRIYFPFSAVATHIRQPMILSGMQR